MPSSNKFKETLGKIFSAQNRPYVLSALTGGALGGGVGYLTGNALWKDPSTGQLVTTTSLGAGTGALAALALLASIKSKQKTEAKKSIAGVSSLNDVQAIKNSSPFNQALYGVKDTGNGLADSIGGMVDIVNKDMPTGLVSGTALIGGGLLGGGAASLGVDQLSARKQRKNIIANILHDYGENGNQANAKRLNERMKKSTQISLSAKLRNKLNQLLGKIPGKKKITIPSNKEIPIPLQTIYKYTGMGQRAFQTYIKRLSKMPNWDKVKPKYMGQFNAKDYRPGRVLRFQTRPTRGGGKLAGAGRLLATIIGAATVGGAASGAVNRMSGATYDYRLRNQMLGNDEGLREAAAKIAENWK